MSESECIDWTGRLWPSGYGAIWFQGRNQRAHRVAWVKARGPIPPGLMVLHRCHRPACVNLDHLYLGTQKENAADRKAAGHEMVPRPIRKLTWDQACEIRRRGHENQRHLAVEYGVSQRTIVKILHGLSYRAPAQGDTTP